MTDSVEVLQSIDKKMDVVIKLLALNSVKGLDEVSQIKTLRGLNLTFEEIATYLGTTPDAARMKLKRSMKKKGPKQGEKSGKQKRN